MDKYQMLGLVSQIVTAASVVPYVRGTLRGVIVPNRITWAIWSVIGISLYVTAKANPNSDEIAVMFAAVLAINPSVIFFLAVWKGSTEPIGRMEMLAVLVAAIALALWWHTREAPGLSPTLLAILADVCALVPTIRFVMQSPDQDRPAAWACFTVGSIFAILGTQQWNLESLVLPVYMALASLFIVVPLVRYRMKNRIPVREWI